MRAMKDLAAAVVMIVAAGAASCSDGGGPARVCDPGAVQRCPCLGGGEGVQVCAEDAARWGECACGAADAYADAEEAADAETETDAEAETGAETETGAEADGDAPGDGTDPDECETGATRCSLTGQRESCAGGLWSPDDCPISAVCVAGACVPVVCDEADNHCEDDLTRSICNASGTGFVTEPCPPGSQCADGGCYDPCEAAGLRREYFGCDFLAADLPNDATASDNIFAFAFANPSAGETAAVTIAYPNGRVEFVDVGPASMAIHELPVPRTTMIRGSGVLRQGFRITSTSPVAAFMFNPWERYDSESGATVASNDASLLIPAPALGREYFAMTWSDPGMYSGPPYVTVAALSDGTHVTITPTEDITFSEAPYLAPAGADTTFTLNAHEVLNLEATAATGVGADLTGTRIASDSEVAVFSGNVCARVPDEARFCDHLETQLPPVETWGKVHVVSKFTDRGGESDYFRVMALADGTALTFDPPRSGVPALDRGRFYELASTAPFVVSSEQPILVGQFMASQSMTSPDGPFGESEYCPYEIGGSCWGDPSLVLAAPVEQLRGDYVFLVPDTYLYTFVDLAFRAGTSIGLGGVALDLSGSAAVGGSGWRVQTLAATAGYQALTADGPVAVVTYGFDHNISYACNGGLDYRDLTGGP